MAPPVSTFAARWWSSVVPTWKPPKRCHHHPGGKSRWRDCWCVLIKQLDGMEDKMRTRYLLMQKWLDKFCFFIPKVSASADKWICVANTSSQKKKTSSTSTAGKYTWMQCRGDFFWHPLWLPPGKRMKKDLATPMYQLPLPNLTVQPQKRNIFQASFFRTNTLASGVVVQNVAPR